MYIIFYFRLQSRDDNSHTIIEYIIDIHELFFFFKVRHFVTYSDDNNNNKINK